MVRTEIIRKWLERVEYDMDTAIAMLKAKKYIYVIFMCQQSIEKCLKAMLAYMGKEVTPIHNLRRLSALAGIIEELENSRLIKLDFLSRYYINARYKEDLQELSKGITEKTAQDFIQFSEEIIKWLYQKMKQ
ncbi:MAG: HEPN domain-containing protein [Deltaproteobacteria bacterium]|nr:HEPN domain-containing protein [Deltaproteobacteria bacterium]